MKIIALLASYNERRFIAACLEHLARNGVDAYLCDNESTDQTVEIARRHLGRGLIGIETIKRHAVFDWASVLRRKEQLAQSLDADWFIHMDPDEFRLPHRSGMTLAQAIEEADAEGWNAVHFNEFVFIPTREAPDHDHPRFMETMRWYYPFLPFRLNRVNAWKRQTGPVDLASAGGHRVEFPGRKICPRDFKMRHYMYLSREHAAEKYTPRKYAADETAKGWHGWRTTLQPDQIPLPDQKDLRAYIDDDHLDPGRPLTRHIIDAA